MSTGFLSNARIRKTQLMCVKEICRSLAAVLGGMTLTVAAETNSAPQLAGLFILPEPHLRTEYTEPQPSRPEAAKAVHMEIQHTDSMQFTMGRGDRFFQPYQRFDLIKQTHESDDVLTRFIDSTLRPEVYHLGRTTTFSCSILTAIKRRNPLCLLNVQFLELTW
jgi:hypothetical protein